MNTISKSLVIATFAISLVTMLAVSTNTDVLAKKPDRPTKCNAIKILVKVSGVEVNQTYTATINLGTGQKTKSGTADDNVSLTLPVIFHKISPCPEVGFQYSGDVNGTQFIGSIQSLKKPNKVTVALS